MALHPCIGFSLLAQLPADDGRHPHGEPHKQRQDPQCGKGEWHRIQQHHGDVDHRKDRIEQHGEGRAGEEAADLFQFGNSAADFTNGPFSEVTQRQPQQVMDDRRPEGDVDPVGGVGEQVGAQRTQERLGQGHGHQQGAQHIEAGVVPLADHRIDDLLNQQRVEQAQQLHEKAGDHHLQQSIAVLLDGWHEPAEAKARFRCAGTALQAQHRQLLASALLKQLSGIDPALTRDWITNQQLLLAGLPQHQGMTVEQGDCRKRQSRQEISAVGLQACGAQAKQIADGGHRLQG